jgi:hypothetical protein
VCRALARHDNCRRGPTAWTVQQAQFIFGARQPGSRTFPLGGPGGRDLARESRPGSSRSADFPIGPSVDVEQDRKAGHNRNVENQPHDGDGVVGVALVCRSVLRQRRQHAK